MVAIYLIRIAHWESIVYQNALITHRRNGQSRQ